MRERPDLSTRARYRARMTEMYDTLFDHPVHNAFHGDGYSNFGYWANGARTGAEAGDALMEELLSSIPQKSGRILDVACGKGGTTEYLARYYDPGLIYGINISPWQLARAKQASPKSTFLEMDATRLDFPPDFFDAVICVEAAFHFRTRKRFLEQAFRVLKPGGRLVLSDVLFAPWTHWSFNRPGGWHANVPSGNYVPSIACYQELYASTGFENLCVRPARSTTWEPFVRAVWRAYPGLCVRHLTPLYFLMWLQFALWMSLGIREYLLVSAVKPR